LGGLGIVRKTVPILALAIGLMLMASCSSNDDPPKGAESQSIRSSSKPVRIVFLHHSTGQVVLVGNTPKIVFKVTGKGDVAKWISNYNRSNGASLRFEAVDFPTGQNYEWANYPFDYHNIWVRHAGAVPYKGEPTLEMLTSKYDVIVWKHCYPVGEILADTGKPDVDSKEKRLENYKAQYLDLRDKMRSFPDTKFIVWTGAALVKDGTTPEQAARTRQFFDWVKSEWDEPGDNIFLWDFYELETEGGLYLKDEYAKSRTDSHPRSDFGGRVAPLFGQRIVSVVQGRGDAASLTGETD
jgi:hypothetical protein